MILCVKNLSNKELFLWGPDWTMNLFPVKIAIVCLFMMCATIWHPAYAAHPAQTILNSQTGQSIEENHSDSEVVAAETEEQVASGAQKFLGGFSITDTQVALEQFLQVLYWRLDILLTANLAKVPYDLSEVMNRISQGHGVAGFIRMFSVLMVVFSLALGVELLFRWLILNRFKPNAQSLEGRSGVMRVWLILSQAIPEFMALGLFVGAAYSFYVLIYAEYFSGICPLYLSMETTIITARSISIVSKILFSPADKVLRLPPFDDISSRVGHRSVQLFAWLGAGGFLFVSLVEHAGLVGDSKLVIRICFGSLLIIALILLLIFQRKNISGWIRGDETLNGSFRGQLAGKWLPVALCYIGSLWVLWIVRLLIVGPEFGFAFAISFMIVPLYLLLDSLLGWLLCSLNSTNEEEQATVLEDERGDAQPAMLSYLRNFGRIVLCVLLGLWVLSLWGEGIAFSNEAKVKAMEVLFILCVSFLLWKIINKIISTYLDNRAKIHAESEEDVDSEWGDAPMLDRGQTLLPLLRKFIGIIMLVLVLLFILSTLGINIAPLLAGAGVVGIAIGFGAQKLVSDVLSGFFYLLDDAFRVGEYIKTSSISGAVEKLTLRNVMLRHHRGMLQIVPYSDLGAITNYMRGGIVVKFNLQFPYDTDVDQVRKVIKKVGIAMLNDPEFGKNFIKQVKSQGIREVADSVLTIRVKFTAHPGTHFLIRREAYRRITEALAEKGIFYAHRKVIVEVPESTDHAAAGTDENRKRIAEAGAAAQLATENK